MSEPENLHTKFANFEQLIATQHGELMDALSGLSTKLSQIIAAISAIPPGSTNMAPTNAILNEMADLLGTISTSIGVPDADLPVNALTWLDHIAANTLRSAECCEEQGGSPPASGVGSCTAPVVSTSILGRQVFTAPSGGNPGIAFFYNVAIFTPPLHPDLTTDNAQGAAYENGYIDAPREGWDGWRVYVQSDAPTYTDDPNGLPIYPVSTCRALTGIEPKMFSVTPPHQIKVFLCSPGDSGSGPTIDCTTTDSQAVTALPRTAGVPIRQMAIVPGWPDLQTDLVINPDSYTARFESACVHYGELEGYQVSSISGRIRMVYRTATTGNVAVTTINTGEAFTLPAGTYTILFDDFVAPETATSGPFTMELCPPSPM